MGEVIPCSLDWSGSQREKENKQHIICCSILLLPAASILVLKLYKIVAICILQLRSCVKVEVGILGSPSLISFMVSVAIKHQQRKKKLFKNHNNKK